MGLGRAVRVTRSTVTSNQQRDRLALAGQRELFPALGHVGRREVVQVGRRVGFAVPLLVAASRARMNLRRAVEVDRLGVATDKRPSERVRRSACQPKCYLDESVRSALLPTFTMTI